VAALPPCFRITTAFFGGSKYVIPFLHYSGNAVPIVRANIGKITTALKNFATKCPGSLEQATRGHAVSTSH
jgi:hypothetical protein